jgi:hypothetical protein
MGNQTINDTVEQTSAWKTAGAVGSAALLLSLGAYLSGITHRNISENMGKVIDNSVTLKGTFGTYGDANCIVYGNKSFVILSNVRYSPNSNHGLRQFLLDQNPLATRSDLNVLERAFHVANSPQLQNPSKLTPGYEIRVPLNSQTPKAGTYNVPWQVNPWMCNTK